VTLVHGENLSEQWYALPSKQKPFGASLNTIMRDVPRPEKLPGGRRLNDC